MQEWMARTNPRDAASKPGTNGGVASAFQVPFVPTRFVAGVGQLDNAGTAEIVVGADGNPGASANFVRVYTEAGSGWVSEDVPVGPYGVTSITVGQTPGRSPAIYAGLRKVGGNGRVVELLKKDGVWQTNVIADSQSETAEVIGIRTTSAGTDLVLNPATRFGPDGALYRATFEDSVWKLALLNAEPARHATATMARTAVGVAADRVLRLLDAGGIQDAGSQPGLSSSLDEFDGSFLNLKTWTFGGGPSGSYSIRVADGLAQLDIAWPGNLAGASAYIETN
ncbi:MAG: hypothetical protein HY736_19295 [Verrucomicrobia bacterium]|nr:hypothetical protein [Verrucomicrobiota bacterium]